MAALTYFAREPLPPRGEIPRVFLAGPTPRAPEASPEPLSWRRHMVRLIQREPPSWIVSVPEDSGFGAPRAADPEDQDRWEWKALADADVVLFWIPRDLNTLPDFTTNIEFGLCIERDPQRVVLGVPPGTPKCRYLTHLYHARTGRRHHTTMEATWGAAKMRLECMGQRWRY